MLCETLKAQKLKKRWQMELPSKKKNKTEETDLHIRQKIRAVSLQKGKHRELAEKHQILFHCPSCLLCCLFQSPLQQTQDTALDTFNRGNV